jgi:hypothetical protein
MISTDTGNPQKPADMQQADYDFLMTKKASGMGFEDAKAALVKAKQGYLQRVSPTVSTVLDTYGKAKTAEAKGELEGVKPYESPSASKAVGRFVQGAGRGLVEGVESFTAKPLGLLVGVGAEEGSFRERLGENLQTGSEQIFGKAESKAEEYGRSFGKGVEMVGGAVIGGGLAKTGLSKLGAKGATSQFLGSSIGSTIGAELAQGELPTKTDVGVGLVADLALGAIGKTVPWLKTLKNYTVGKVGTEKTTKAIAEVGLEKAGIQQIDRNLLNQIPENLRGYAQNLYSQALKRSKNALDVKTGQPMKSAMDLVADDISKIDSSISSKISEVGKNIDKAKGLMADAPKISTSSMANSFKNMLEKDLGVTFKKGVANFDNSTIAGLGSEQKLMSDIYDYLRKDTLKDPVSVLNKIRNIFNRIDVEDIKATQRPASTVRLMLKESLEGIPGEYGKLSKQYAKLLEVKDDLARMGKGEITRAPEFLRRLFGKAPGQAKSTIQSIQEAGKEFGIKEADQVIEKSAMAEMFDSLLSGKPRQSFAGQIEEALPDVIRSPKATLTKKAIDFVSSKLLGTPEKSEAIEGFFKAMENPETKKALLPIVGKIDQALGAIPELQNMPELVKALRAFFQSSLD